MPRNVTRGASNVTSRVAATSPCNCCSIGPHLLTGDADKTRPQFTTCKQLWMVRLSDVRVPWSTFIRLLRHVAILKLAFTRALICLSKYGEEMTLNATPDEITLSCTNSSMTAYCSFKYSRDFFQRYNLGPAKQSRYGHGETSRSARINDEDEPKHVINQVQTKVISAYPLHLKIQ